MAILVSVLVISAAAVLLLQQENEANGATVDSIMYIDTDGTSGYKNDVTEVTSEYLTGVSYELDAGWYIAAGQSVFQTIKITGDVHLILDGSVNVVNNGFSIQSGARLTLYGQGKTGDRLSSSGTAVQLKGGSLVNAASISCNSSNKTIIDVKEGDNNSITNYGTISPAGSNSKAIASAVDLTIINNYVNDKLSGKIMSSGGTSYAIYSTADVIIVNEPNSSIESSGAETSVIFANGITLTNSGTIRGVGNLTDAIDVKAPSTVTNNSDGTIIGSGNTILMKGGGQVVNSGTIGAAGCGYGIYLNGGKITNNSDSIILGGSNGVTFAADGELYNAGHVGGTVAVEAINAASIKLTNTKYLFGAVTLADVANDVTFAAGSGIYHYTGTGNTGNFTIGSDPTSKLNFTGSPNALLYVKIQGKADIGSATATVDIEVSGIPSTLQVGDKLLLISGGTATGSPKNPIFSGAGHDFSVRVENNRLIADFQGPTPYTYGIVLSENDHTFEDATQGYSAQTPFSVTVTNIGTGATGELTVTISGADASSFTVSPGAISDIAAGGNAIFTIVPNTGLDPGSYAATVTVAPSSDNSNPVNTETVEVRFTVDAVPGPISYCITATSDTGSVINPSGEVSILEGSDGTFKFRALKGYEIKAVIVDGRSISKSMIGTGSYTFENVAENHTIEIVSAKTAPTSNNVTDTPVDVKITLIVDIMKGKGHTEYSVNGSQFVKYDSVVTLQKYDNVAVRAYAADGYQFIEWVFNGMKYKEAAMTFENVTVSIYLEVYFDEKESVAAGIDSTQPEGTSSAYIGTLILAFAAGLLILFFIFWRRYYEVIKPEAAIGAERAHRKSEYRFMVEGHTGDMEYRIGEDKDAEWTTISPNEEGEYIIPRGKIVDKVFIEFRSR